MPDTRKMSGREVLDKAGGLKVSLPRIYAWRLPMLLEALQQYVDSTSDPQERLQRIGLMQAVLDKEPF